MPEKKRRKKWAAGCAGAGKRRRDAKMRRRSVARYLRRVRRRKYRRRRRAAALLFCVAVFYLAAIGAFRPLIFHVTRERTVEYRLPCGRDSEKERVRIVFRPRTGEILIIREEAEPCSREP